METIPEILLIDKPKGITSFDVIRVLRRKLGVRKMGHAGTLDPLASGLMIIGVGTGTKELKEYVALPKEYISEILVGEKRTTGDMEGEIIEKVHVDALDQDHVREELKEMIGVLRLPVSAYSAVKRGGVRMYRCAREAEKEGRHVDSVPFRDMEVMEAELYGTETLEDACVLSVRWYVGSGTYIRSLAEELGRRLGYPATLKNLRRTKVGEFDVADAEKLDVNMFTRLKVKRKNQPPEHEAGSYGGA